MALQKEIYQDDGIVTNYHRILFIHKTINKNITIAVLSYHDEAGRKMELGKNQPYKVTKTYMTEYDESMTVAKAYEWLKTLPEFEGAEDV